ncbi:hypothetical protein ALC53_01444 [Atta colombica]|uniref:Uncharacterized protein n=1 Tax=Atta colombica TaxID=520822 RepID=A0A195BTT1_9HYME|nr:hypothetical protein ALC53_01444 [Atta colombica]
MIAITPGKISARYLCCGERARSTIEGCRTLRMPGIANRKPDERTTGYDKDIKKYGFNNAFKVEDNNCSFNENFNIAEFLPVFYANNFTNNKFYFFFTNKPQFYGLWTLRFESKHTKYQLLNAFNVYHKIFNHNFTIYLYNIYDIGDKYNVSNYCPSTVETYIENENGELLQEKDPIDCSGIRMAINNNEPLKDILNQWPVLRKSKSAFYSEDNIESGFAVLQIFSKYFKEDIGKFIFEVKVCPNLNGL